MGQVRASSSSLHGPLASGISARTEWIVRSILQTRRAGWSSTTWVAAERTRRWWTGCSFHPLVRAVFPSWSSRKQGILWTRGCWYHSSEAEWLERNKPTDNGSTSSSAIESTERKDPKRAEHAHERAKWRSFWHKYYFFSSFRGRQCRSWDWKAPQQAEQGHPRPVRQSFQILCQAASQRAARSSGLRRPDHAPQLHRPSCRRPRSSRQLPRRTGKHHIAPRRPAPRPASRTRIRPKAHSHRNREDTPPKRRCTSRHPKLPRLYSSRLRREHTAWKCKDYSSGYTEG